MKLQRGSFILEFLVTSTLSLIFFSGVILMYKDTTRAIGRILNHLEKSRLTTAVIPHIQRAVMSVDTHRLALLPRIGTDSLTFSDGTPIRTGSKNAPSSSALYFAITQPIPPQKVDNKRLAGDGLDATICPPILEDRNGFFDAIALTPDGIFEVTAAIKDDAHCKVIHVTSCSPLLTQTLRAEELLTTTILIPLKEKNILFTDTERVFRILRLHGGAVIENQPLVNNLPLLHFFVTTPGPSLYSLTTQIGFADGSSYDIPFLARLSRESSLLPLGI